MTTCSFHVDVRQWKNLRAPPLARRSEVRKVPEGPALDEEQQHGIINTSPYRPVVQTEHSANCCSASPFPLLTISSKDRSQALYTRWCTCGRSSSASLLLVDLAAHPPLIELLDAFLTVPNFGSIGHCPWADRRKALEGQ